MVTLRELLQRPGKSHLMTVHVKGDEQGEIEPQNSTTNLDRSWAKFGDYMLQLVFNSRSSSYLLQVLGIKDPKTIRYLTLPDAMGEYLFNTSLCAINLVGPNSRSQLCELDVNTYSFVMRLSTGWSVFAAINEIGVGNQLQFNMCDMYDNHYGWVGKLV
ncbi:unnamed protein product [Vicia faba]|uniref:Uncharacterized protein n=1 Tax=Vicia faba TaxID=3906 RepID=A0AAV1AIQ0_VICFA|nr:unnamed protein product [Vicia faba]